MKWLTGLFMVMLLLVGCTVAKTTSTVDAMTEEEYLEYAEDVKFDVYSINEGMVVLMNDLADFDIEDEDEWATTFIRNKEKAEVMLEKSKEIQPPSKYETAHDTLELALEKYYSGFENIDLFIDTQDIDDITQANEDVSASMEYMMDYLDMTKE